MIRVRLVVDDKVLFEIASGAKTLAPRLQRAVTARMPRLKSQVLTITAVRPGPVVYAATSAAGNPMLRWKSRAQQITAHKTRNWGAGMPYGRTGALLAAYDVILDATDINGVITLTNSNPAAPFVVGQFQQPFHQDTGWVNVDTVHDRNVAFALDTIFDAWNEVT